MLNMLKNKIQIVANIKNCSLKEALWHIADAEMCDDVSNYLVDMLEYHERLDLADWLSKESY